MFPFSSRQISVTVFSNRSQEKVESGLDTSNSAFSRSPTLISESLFAKFSFFLDSHQEIIELIAGCKLIYQFDAILIFLMVHKRMMSFLTIDPLRYPQFIVAEVISKTHSELCVFCFIFLTECQANFMGFFNFAYVTAIFIVAVIDADICITEIPAAVIFRPFIYC